MDSPLPLQPILQGVLLVSGQNSAVPGTPTFQGRGVSDVKRTVVAGIIFFDLVLDEGLPGNSGEVASEGDVFGPNATPQGAGSGASSFTNIPTPDIRCSVTIRGSETNALSGGAGTGTGGTDIVSVGVSYLSTALNPSKDSGFTIVRLCFAYSNAGVLTSIDPTDSHAAGAEIIVYKDASAIQ